MLPSANESDTYYVQVQAEEVPSEPAPEGQHRRALPQRALVHAAEDRRVGHQPITARAAGGGYPGRRLQY